MVDLDDLGDHMDFSDQPSQKPKWWSAAKKDAAPTQQPAEEGGKDDCGDNLAGLDFPEAKDNAAAFMASHMWDPCGHLSLCDITLNYFHGSGVDDSSYHDSSNL